MTERRLSGISGNVEGEAPGKMNSLEELLTCQHHLHFYNDPKRMPECPHVFCRSCIDELHNDETTVVTCPVCDHDQKLPPRGAAALMTDINLMNMIKNFTCLCGNVSTNTRHCASCNVRFCPDCADDHKDPMKCVVSRATEKLEKLMTYEFKKKLGTVVVMNKAAIQKIQTMKKEVNAMDTFLRGRLDKLKKDFLEQLPNERGYEDKNDLLKELVLNSGVIEYSKTLLNYKHRPESLTTQEATLNKMLQIATMEGITDEPKAAVKAEAIHEEFMLLCGRLGDYETTKATTVAELSEGDVRDVAWHPQENKVSVSTGQQLHHILPGSTKGQVNSSKASGTTITAFVITTRGEYIYTDGMRVYVLGLETSIQCPERCLALAAYDIGVSRRVYMISDQNVFYARLLYGKLENFQEMSLEIELKKASDITTDKNGLLYICEKEYGGVFIFTHKGDQVADIMEAGPRLMLSSPSGVCIDPYDNVLVSDEDHHQIHVYNGSLKYVTSLRDSELVSRPGKLAVDKMKRVFVMDRNKKHVVVFHDNWSGAAQHKPAEGSI